MNIQALVKAINTSNLSIEDLRILNQLVVRKIKAQRKAESILAGVSLQVGDVIRVNHPKLEGQTGKITKVKRTKCDIVMTGSGNAYTVPMAMVAAL